jgi:hypothetical protein
MPARKRKAIQPDWDDTVESAVAEFFDSRWEQWRDQFGIYGVVLERDDKGGLVLTVEVSPDAAAVSSTRALVPSSIELPMAGGIAPLHLDVRIVERRPPVKQQRIAGGTMGFGDLAGGRASNGTLGGWAWDTTDDSLVLLSCQHVLGPQGDDVHLGPVLGRVKIGKVKRSIPYSPAVPLDCGIATIDLTHDPAFVIESLGAAIMMTDDQVRRNLPTRKRAAVTHLRHGKVVAASHRVTFKDGEHYPRLIEVQGVGADWSKDGDSGALVFDDEVYESGLRAVIGLHFAGHEELDKNGFALRIGEVFTALHLTTLPDGLLTALLVEATGSRAGALVARDAFIELYFLVDPTPLSKALLAVIEDAEYLLRLTLDRSARRSATQLLKRVLEKGATVDKILEHRIAAADATLLDDAPAGLDAASRAALTALVDETTRSVGKTLGETLLEQS